MKLKQVILFFLLVIVNALGLIMLGITHFVTPAGIESEYHTTESNFYFGIVIYFTYNQFGSCFSFFITKLAF